MKTAIKWLVEDLIEKGLLIANGDTLKSIGKAKKMEKEQIVEAFVDGADKGEMFNNENRAFTTDAEQYYNETFKSEY